MWQRNQSIKNLAKQKQVDQIILLKVSGWGTLPVALSTQKYKWTAVKVRNDVQYILLGKSDKILELNCDGLVLCVRVMRLCAKETHN